jgi:hypothetical protein
MERKALYLPKIANKPQLNGIVLSFSQKLAKAMK